MRKPNVVFILVDDMGYGDFSAFNGGLSSTPALDGLLRESVCFAQQYTASPVCNPSRACLMTGRYPQRTGSIDTLEWRGLERLALGETTLADVFKAGGYRTGLVGKWHLGAFDERYHPRNRGFDETVCFRGGMHDYYAWRVEFGDSVRRSDGRYLTDVWTQEAVGFIERHQTEPFFLHVTYNAPHTPLQVPAEDLAPFAGRTDLTRAVKHIYAMIRHLDAGVGRILETLDRCGLRDNTILMFSSDNGPQFGGKPGTEDCLNRFNCGLNRAKGHVYDGGIRVPMIMRWPDGIEGRGRRLDDMVHFSDWFPTLTALAGVRVPGDLNLDGVDVSPLLRGEKGKTCTKRFWQWNRYTPDVHVNAAVRDGDWKLVRPSVNGIFDAPCCNPWLTVSMYAPEYFEKNGLLQEPEPARNWPPPPPAELYNLATDPNETTNVAAAHPDLVSRLSRDLENWFAEVEGERRALCTSADMGKRSAES